MKTMQELQDELESMAPGPLPLAELRATARRRRRRQHAARTAVGVAAVTLVVVGITQVQDSRQTLETAGETSASREEAPVPEAESDPSPSPSANASDPCSDREGIGVAADDFLGLPESTALANAVDQGLTAVVECRDGESLIGVRPGNIDSDRLWLTVTDGVVTNAYRG